MGYGHRKGAININNIKYADAHAHYICRQFNKDRDEIINKLHRNGCEYIIECGGSIRQNQKVIELSNSYNFIYTTLGYFPLDVRDLYIKGERDNFLKSIKEEKVRCIGEIGFDYSREGASPKEQEKEFRWQIETAIENNLPICVHSRDAKEDTLRVLREYFGLLPIYIHSYCYDYDTAMELNENGIYFGCGGMLTYPNNKELRFALRDVNEDRIMFETDAPYLPPQPFRGQRCDSSMIIKTAEVLAGVREENPEKLLLKALKNTKTFYKINDEI